MTRRATQRAPPVRLHPTTLEPTNGEYRPMNDTDIIDHAGDASPDR